MLEMLPGARTVAWVSDQWHAEVTTSPAHTLCCILCKRSLAMPAFEFWEEVECQPHHNVLQACVQQRPMRAVM